MLYRFNFYYGLDRFTLKAVKNIHVMGCTANKALGPIPGSSYVFIERSKVL